MTKKLLAILLSAFALFAFVGAVDSFAAAYPPAVGGTGTVTAPTSGKTLIGNGAGTYTPALITPGTDIIITNASGSITIAVRSGDFLPSSTVYVATVNGQSGAVTITSSTLGTLTLQTVLNSLSATGLATYSTTTTSGTISVSSSSLNLKSASQYNFGDFLPSSTVYVTTVNGQSGAVTLGIPATSTITASGTTLTGPGFTFGTSTTVLPYASGTQVYWALVNTGNWAGTWQGVNSSTFYLASNPSGFITTSSVSINGVQGNVFTGLATSTGLASYIVTSANSYISVSTTTTSAALTFSTSSFGSNAFNSTAFISTSTYNGNFGTAAIRPSTDFLASSTNLAPSTTIPVTYVGTFNGVSGTVTFQALQNASITANAPITWSGSSVIGFNTSTAMNLSGLYTFLGGATFNSTATYNSSTVFTGSVSSTEQNALILATGTGKWGSYAGSSCGTQGVSAISASGTATCTTFATSTGGGGGTGSGNLFTSPTSSVVTSSVPYYVTAASSTVAPTSGLYLFGSGNAAIGSSTDNGLLSAVNASGTIALQVASTTNNANALTVYTTLGSSSLTIASSGLVSLAAPSSTIRIGTGGINPGCIELYDAVNSSTIDYIYASSTTMIVTATKPNFCY